MGESLSEHGEKVVSTEAGDVEDRFNAGLWIWIFDEAAKGVGRIGGAEEGKEGREVGFESGGESVHESFNLSDCVRVFALGHIEGGFHSDGEVVGCHGAIEDF
jgi:hypothetical protein